MFGKGFQTWEYSPTYAIRSYAYLWIHALPISLYKILFSTNKVDNSLLGYQFIECFKRDQCISIHTLVLE